MKIAVVGATGATGRRVLTRALAQGRVVTTVARHPERLSPDERLTFVRGAVLSRGSRRGAFDDVEAVMSCIGLSDGRELSCFNRLVIRASGRIFAAAVADKGAAERMTRQSDME